MIQQVNQLTDTILTGNAHNLSFEQVYRSMYNFSRAQHVAQACTYLSAKFVSGQWASLNRWIILQDCWLYVIRNHMIAKTTIRNIISTIRCYPKLVDFICDKYHVVPDIRKLIASMVY